MNGVSDEQRERWGRLSEQATPGPWQWSPSRRLLDGDVNGDFRHVVGAGIEATKIDAVFIAEARVAVPALLEENAILRARVEDWRTTAGYVAQERDRLAAEQIQLRAQVAELTAARSATRDAMIALYNDNRYGEFVARGQVKELLTDLGVILEGGIPEEAQG